MNNLAGKSCQDPGSRVSNPHPFHADPDTGFEIFADPDPGLNFSQISINFTWNSVKKKTLDPDQNSDPDPGTFTNPDPDPGTPQDADPMRIRIRNHAWM